MKRILLIDDDKAVRMTILGILEVGGYSVFETENGNTGIGLFRSNPVDLVIVDLFMPEKEGIETIMELRKGYPELKILAISGVIPGVGPEQFLTIAIWNCWPIMGWPKRANCSRRWSAAST